MSVLRGCQQIHLLCYLINKSMDIVKELKAGRSLDDLEEVLNAFNLNKPDIKEFFDFLDEFFQHLGPEFQNLRSSCDQLDWCYHDPWVLEQVKEIIEEYREKQPWNKKLKVWWRNRKRKKI